MIEIKFKGMRNFDTLEDAKAFRGTLGNRYKATQECRYYAVPELNLPEIVFYIVFFDED